MDEESLPTEQELEEMKASYDAFIARQNWRPEISARANYYHGYFAALRRNNG